MNEPLKQFSEQVASELKAKFTSAETLEFIKQTKASGDDRTFEVVFSTADEDRQGDKLDQSTWDLKYYEMNPVVLWAHNYSSFPIGVIEDIKTEGDKSVATGKFAPAGVNPEADMACSLYQEKILRAVSPGYIQNDDGTRELLEVSFCPVPAGRYALSLRQVGRLGVSTRELISKGFFIEEKKEVKAQQVGDSCELEDGSPGVLAEDAGNPGKLTCVPKEGKAADANQEEMKDELPNRLKAEHERHVTPIGKAIDEFETKAFAPKDEKATDNSETAKAMEEFKAAIDSEQGSHIEKCMKAIDDTYDTFGREANKSIDEFKSAFQTEHTEHVDAVQKAVEEFTKDFPADQDAQKKAISEFETKAQDELSRHEQAHEKLLKDEMAKDEKDVKALAEEIIKSGRTISAKTKEKLESIVKAIEDHHTEHGKSIDDVTAALKAIIASGDGGEEPQSDQKPEEAPNARSSTSGANAELETYLFVQRLVRQVKTASEGALRQLNEKVKEHHSARS